MYAVNGTTIVLTRGDTFICDVEIDADGEPYVPKEGESVRFAVKRKLFTPDKGNYVDSVPLIHKDIPIGSMMLQLLPEDTKKLKFGIYAYDVEITMTDGKVDTFLSGDLDLRPEVE